jgi:hypothetical protein
MELPLQKPPKIYNLTGSKGYYRRSSVAGNLNIADAAPKEKPSENPAH